MSSKTTPRGQGTGILHALPSGAHVDKNTNKIVVRVGTSNETIIFNIGGTIFETYRTTLRAVPTSYLADDAFLTRHYRPEKKDYFFDRDPEIFLCVLNYLRTGELHLPTSVCGPVVKSELEYWGIDEVDIEECCWSRYSAWSSTLKALRKLEEDRQASTQLGRYPHKESPSAVRQFCETVWTFFSSPSSSRAAQIYAYISLSIIFISIFAFCAQTHEIFKVKESYEVLNTTHPTTSPAVSLSPNTTNSSSSLPFDDEPLPNYYTVVRDVPHPVLYYVDMACFIYFVIELLARLFTSPYKCKFLVLHMTVVEILALLPDIIDLLARLISSSYREYEKLTEFMSFMKLLRVFRVFRLMRHIPGLWILFYTLKASMRDLLLLLLFVCVGMLVFSSLIYFAEHSGAHKDDFSSIPKCFWWAVITMTTVGYGDMYPVTYWGYLIGTATGIAGVLMIGFTVPVLVNNFMMYYSHTTSTIDREKHKKNSGSTRSLNKNGGSNGASTFKGGMGGNMLGGFGKNFLSMQTPGKDSDDDGHHKDSNDNKMKTELKSDVSESESDEDKIVQMPLATHNETTTL